MSEEQEQGLRSNAQSCIAFNIFFELFGTKDLSFRSIERRGITAGVSNKQDDGVSVSCQAVQEQVLAEGKCSRSRTLSSKEANTLCLLPLQLQQTYRSSRLWILVVLFLAFLVLVRSAWFARNALIADKT